MANNRATMTCTFQMIIQLKIFQSHSQVNGGDCFWNGFIQAEIWIKMLFKQFLDPLRALTNLKHTNEMSLVWNRSVKLHVTQNLPRHLMRLSTSSKQHVLHAWSFSMVSW